MPHQVKWPNCDVCTFCLRNLQVKSMCRFKKAQFRICAFLPKDNQTREAALSDVHDLEVNLMAMQSSVKIFQKEYLKV